MTSILAKLAQKPSDKAIRITRVVFALVLIALIYLWWDSTILNFGIPESALYALYIFPAIGLIRGILDPGIFRKKIWKWTIVSMGAIMMILSLFILDDVVTETHITPTTTTVSGEQQIRVDDILKNTSETKFSLSTDNWFGFFGFILIIVGVALNGKNITTKNERYGEKVTKIRV
jgi:hypothetical protein